MKNKTLTAVIVCMLLVFMLPLSVCAQSRIVYEGNAQEFIFTPGSEYSPTDLFESFKSVMPGDHLTQDITIDNQAENKVKIRLFLRSDGGSEQAKEFLSQMFLTVKQEGDSVLFAAPADEKAQLDDWVYLGTIYSGGKINLTVSLEVPLTMENDFQNALGSIDWQFKVEELPAEPDDPHSPVTGYDGPLYFCFLIGLALAVLMTMLIIFVKKQTHRYALPASSTTSLTSSRLE